MLLLYISTARVGCFFRRGRLSYFCLRSIKDYSYKTDSSMKESVHENRISSHVCYTVIFALFLIRALIFKAFNSILKFWLGTLAFSDDASQQEAMIDQIQ